MPRVGRFTTRSNEVSSARLETRRKYASASLISARSKKRRPPYTRYGMRAFKNASSNTRDCAFERYSTATSRAKRPLLHPLADAVHDEVRLVALVERRVELDPLPVRAPGPERLAEPAGIVLDERVGRFQDGARRAVVLLQLVQRRLRIVAAELVQILHPGAAPAVNRLIVVAHRERQPSGPASSVSQRYWMAFVS